MSWWEDPRYTEGREAFDGGHYFEAHEIWEALWRPMPAGGGRLFVQGLIQLAVSLEHHRRGNPRGSRGQWAKAVAKLDAAHAGPVDVPRLLAAAAAFLAGEGSAPRLGGATQCASLALPPE